MNERETAIHFAVAERICDLRQSGEPVGVVVSCQCFPKCELTPEEALKQQGCLWCTVHIVWPDGSSFRQEPGHA